jgi:hypothetical protein
MVMVPINDPVLGLLWSWNPHDRAVLNAWLPRDSPGRSVPTFSAGQSVWTGCGFESISCASLALFVNVTVPPTATSTDCGLTPALLIVMVAVIGAGFGFGVGFGGVGLVGGLLESPPHDHAVIPSASAPATKLIARVFMRP